MNGQELRGLLSDTFAHLAASKDELRDLDAALGDGDLGITVAAASQASREVLADADEGSAPSDLLQLVARAFATANPSTFGALTAKGLLAAAKAIEDRDDLERADAVILGRAAAEAVMAGGKSAVGDKTVLDALVPSIDALEGAGDDQALQRMIEAAQRGVEGTKDLRSMRGRAAWIGERGDGHADPGAVAYLRFLESLQKATDKSHREEER